MDDVLFARSTRRELWENRSSSFGAFLGILRQNKDFEISDQNQFLPNIRVLVVVFSDSQRQSLIRLPSVPYEICGIPELVQVCAHFRAVVEVDCQNVTIARFPILQDHTHAVLAAVVEPPTDHPARACVERRPTESLDGRLHRCGSS